MAVIGNRIKQVLRILRDDGQATARMVAVASGESLDGHDAAKYLQRAVELGYAKRVGDKPVVFAITEQGRELLDEVRGVKPPKRSRKFASGPSSVWDYAARSA